MTKAGAKRKRNKRAGHGLTIFELTNATCRYPLLSVKTIQYFCGKPTETKSYCGDHAKICYRKPDNRPDDII